MRRPRDADDEVLTIAGMNQSGPYAVDMPVTEE
jgi:hypothetical protein